MYIQVRCFAELNDYLPNHQRYNTFSLSVSQPCSVQHLVDLINIPSVNIDLVLVNGQSVTLEYVLQENDLVSIYPIFETFDISNITKVRKTPLRSPKFVLDVHLGKLAHLLRMLGFDAAYKNNFTDNMLIDISTKEKRILLSKDKTLINTNTLSHAYLIKNKEPRLQLLEILDKLDLYTLINPFTRCIECNSLLQKVDKKIIFARIPEAVRNWCNEYYICLSCNRIYWKGSHYKHMNSYIEEIFKIKDKNR